MPASCAFRDTINFNNTAASFAGTGIAGGIGAAGAVGATGFAIGSASRFASQSSE